MLMMIKAPFRVARHAARRLYANAFGIRYCTERQGYITRRRPYADIVRHVVDCYIWNTTQGDTLLPYVHALCEWYTSRGSCIDDPLLAAVIRGLASQRVAVRTMLYPGSVIYQALKPARRDFIVETVDNADSRARRHVHRIFMDLLQDIQRNVAPELAADAACLAILAMPDVARVKLTHTQARVLTSIYSDRFHQMVGDDDDDDRLSFAVPDLDSPVVRLLRACYAPPRYLVDLVAYVATTACRFGIAGSLWTMHNIDRLLIDNTVFDGYAYAATVLDCQVYPECSLIPNVVYGALAAPSPLSDALRAAQLQQYANCLGLSHEQYYVNNRSAWICYVRAMCAAKTIQRHWRARYHFLNRAAAFLQCRWRFAIACPASRLCQHRLARDLCRA